jgi:hypothetical protein
MSTHLILSLSKFISSIVIICSFSGFSQTTLKGRVTDWNDNNVPNASCTLVKAKLVAVTDMNGYFDFSKTSGVKSVGQTVRQVTPFSISGMKLRFSVVGQPIPVNVEFFSISGKRIGHIGNKQYGFGDHIVDLSRHIPSASCGIVRVTLGSSSSIFRIVAMSPGHIVSQSSRPLVSSSSSHPHLVASSSIDTLVIIRFGYLTKSFPVLTYDTQMDSLA